jgi:hypothetical protein
MQNSATTARTMPQQKPGKSKQDYGTPKVFLDAVKKKFGIKRFAWDLAATYYNAVDNLGPATGCYYGPDHESVAFRDALACDWSKLGGDLWLNPPYAHIAPWAEKCTARVSRRGVSASAFYQVAYRRRRIFFLVPVAVGSNWFAQHVFDKARVLLLNGRIPFDGCAINPKTGKIDGYIKDCMLAVYGEKPDIEIWRWQNEAR